MCYVLLQKCLLGVSPIATAFMIYVCSIDIVIGLEVPIYLSWAEDAGRYEGHGRPPTGGYFLKVLTKGTIVLAIECYKIPFELLVTHVPEAERAYRAFEHWRYPNPSLHN